MSDEMVTDAEAEGLRGMDALRTKGVYVVSPNDPGRQHYVNIVLEQNGGLLTTISKESEDDAEWLHTARYIAAACNLAPKLLAERDRLRADLAEARRERDEAHNDLDLLGITRHGPASDGTGPTTLTLHGRLVELRGMQEEA